MRRFSALPLALVLWSRGAGAAHVQVNLQYEREPEARRVVLILSDFENVAVQDIAAALGIPLKTAHSRLRVAREELVLAAQRMRKERR